MKRFYAFIACFVLSSIFVWAQPKIGLNVGDKAPELIGESYTGETYRLSDIRGQLVLIDFWASWCRPCRIENPVVVDSYKRFKNKKFENAKGFTVFSVSLDRTADAWQKGSQDDKLEWPYHISDLKGWYSKHAAVYGVRRIPTNFLIDGDGIIIARDLKGAALASTLDKLSRK